MGDVGRIGDCEFLRSEKKDANELDWSLRNPAAEKQVTNKPDWSTGNPETGEKYHQ
jgi:hypothetical protein